MKLNLFKLCIAVAFAIAIVCVIGLFMWLLVLITLYVPTPWDFVAYGGITVCLMTISIYKFLSKQNDEQEDADDLIAEAENNDSITNR